MNRFHKLAGSAMAAVLMSLIPEDVSALANEFTVFSSGKCPSVVLLPGSGNTAQAAAEDMVKVLSRMTGTRFALAAEMKEEPCIVIGLVSEWADIEHDTLGVERLKDTSEESFMLRSSPTRLLILGKTSEGASHGVYTLLRDWGCRWYFPTSDWDVIPATDEIKVSVDRVEAPAMKVRILSNGAGLGASARLFRNWCRRNRLGSEYGQRGVYHSYAGFVPKALFKEHPDYFARTSKDGEPGVEQNGNQPCTTHPEVVRMVKTACLENLRKARAEGTVPRMISVSPNDGTPDMCRCERCMAVGSYGDCALLLANQVAEAIQPEFPVTLVAFLAYGRASAIPLNIKAHPQVLASIAAGYNWKTSVPRLIKEWSGRVRHATVYEYYAINASRPDYDGAKIRDMASTLSLWHRNGIEGVNGEMANDWGSCGHRFWAFAELAWNPSQRPDALMDDFLKYSWGPAIEPMRRYYLRWESGEQATPRTLALSVADLQRAAGLAGSVPEVLRRIDQISVFLYWNLLKREYADAKEDEKAQDRIAREGDILQYRMRDYLMIQMVDSIYKVDRPVPVGLSFEEAAQIRTIMSGKLSSAGPPVELSGPDTSEDLVPMVGKSVTPSTTSDDSRTPFFVSNASYRFRAQSGETVHIRFVTETFQGDLEKEKITGDGVEDADTQPEKAMGRFQLWSLGASGDSLEFLQEENPAGNDGVVHLKFRIPDDAIYQVSVKTKSAGVREDFGSRPYVIVADANNRKDALPFERKKSSLPAAGTNTPVISLVFHVPRNTRNFLFKASNLNEIKASFTPGKDEKAVTVSPEDKRSGEVLVEVPPGTDGRTWTLRMSSKPGTIGLGGIPPFLAVNESDLLIPRECLDP